MAEQTHSDRNSTAVAPVPSPEQVIEAMIARYSPGIYYNTAHNVSHLRLVENEVVLLTGSTGNLGAQLLLSLLSMRTVKRVYVLNRPHLRNLSMMDRHQARFKEKGLDTSILYSPKLVFLEGRNSLPGLGLAADAIKELQGELTMVVHTAWNLNLWAPLSKFESNIKGTRTLIDIVQGSEHRADVRFLFTSTISACFSWDRARGPYPEEVIKDAKYAVGLGYGESKYITERILAQSGINATILRCGQFSGGEPNGAWPVWEWFPILLRSALQVGSFPNIDHCYTQYWVPMDAVSNTILDIAFSKEKLPLVVNVQQPHTIRGEQVIQMLRNALVEKVGLPSPDSLPLIHPGEWIWKLRRMMQDDRLSPESREIVEAMINISISYRIPQAPDTPSTDDHSSTSKPRTTQTVLSLELDSSNAKRLSSTIRELKPIDETMVNKWVEYWVRVGFIERRSLAASRPHSRL